ncbi:alpha-amylase [Agaricicola taiwanensis]|uniref:Alpha-amylase n=1 Tax=Agaricicola taiwanensis TaxID=591372 RepID=A0A8J2VK35_9RHOB|nr:alpha-amylase family glycosyl hydrolase [Agaricicola taiwanensis]GGE28642.1 alpha-amylase [Agaricicola taiwanensis]
MATEWWKSGVIYQIYPRSFQDSDGDGIGDLKGIRDRLAYVASLGVDAIWISPIFVSPMADFGYDIADYCAIDPLFGTLDDFDALMAEAKRLELRVILDLVPNHTSDQHPWFKESRSSRNSAKRDWYIWRDAKADGSVPNNWISNFGGSAWSWDEATGQYYYHAFLKEQPDLNWRNPEVREAISDVMRFWMARGADGFRVDVIWHLMKDPEFRDNPPNPAWQPSQPEINRLLQVHSADHPDIEGLITELRRVIDEYPDRVLIGEIYLPMDRLMAYYGRGLSGTHLPFNFLLLQAPWSAPKIAQLIAEYEAALPPGGWPNWVLGNHDQPRLASRTGLEQTRVAAMLLLTLRGTPTLYYGDEIGMQQVPVPPEAVRDTWELREPGLGFNRDPQRTPMQWNGSSNSGFTTATPWLPMAANAAECNVATMAQDPHSLLALYRSLIALRHRMRALQLGSYHPLFHTEHVLAYERRLDDTRLVVLLNLGQTDEEITLPEYVAAGRVLLATEGELADIPLSSSLTLPGNAGLIVRLPLVG